ncbi:hypothetical protein AQUCO_00200496v1 [Aquilegia coerulea]|uniref:Uncharacterized protein n=1 Tax=Aquilegia coerulea TaxID=218851 RepID=A0A2G5F3E8_AQUCA|nr:hypothetical protein AQUCO_00200496v1 [Aquilegia coerulea]
MNLLREDDPKIPLICVRCFDDRNYGKFDFNGTKTCEKCTDPFRFLIWSTGCRFTRICRTCSIDENICQFCLVPFTKPPFITPWEQYSSPRVDFYEVYEPATPPAADTYKSTSLRGIQLSHGSPDVDNPNIQPRSRFPDYLLIVKDPVYFIDYDETQESKHSCSTTESRSPDH